MAEREDDERPLPPNKCQTLDDIPTWFRMQFENGETPMDEPPGFTELYYKAWKRLGGTVIPPKPVTMDDL